MITSTNRSNARPHYLFNSVGQLNGKLPQTIKDALSISAKELQRKEENKKKKAEALERRKQFERENTRLEQEKARKERDKEMRNIDLDELNRKTCMVISGCSSIICSRVI